MIKLIVFITLLSTNIRAQEPTIVYGESELPDGKKDSILLIQPENAPNPLGNPIVYTGTNNQTNTINSTYNNKARKYLLTGPRQITQINKQNPPPFSISPQKLKNQIENTLYQGGNRIYDVQSYPIEDINKITEPNIDPTITTYPEY